MRVDWKKTGLSVLLSIGVCHGAIAWDLPKDVGLGGNAARAMGNFAGKADFDWSGVKFQVGDVFAGRVLFDAGSTVSGRSFLDLAVTVKKHYMDMPSTSRVAAIRSDMNGLLRSLNISEADVALVSRHYEGDTRLNETEQGRVDAIIKDADPGSLRVVVAFYRIKQGIESDLDSTYKSADLSAGARRIRADHFAKQQAMYGEGLDTYYRGKTQSEPGDAMFVVSEGSGVTVKTASADVAAKFQTVFSDTSLGISGRDVSKLTTKDMEGMYSRAVEKILTDTSIDSKVRPALLAVADNLHPIRGTFGRLMLSMDKGSDVMADVLSLTRQGIPLDGRVGLGEVDARLKAIPEAFTRFSTRLNKLRSAALATGAFGSVAELDVFLAKNINLLAEGFEMRIKPGEVGQTVATKVAEAIKADVDSDEVRDVVVKTLQIIRDFEGFSPKHKRFLGEIARSIEGNKDGEFAIKRLREFSPVARACAKGK